jgi:hypothetical protein
MVALYIDVKVANVEVDVVAAVEEDVFPKSS